MPAIAIESPEQYTKALDVLTAVGGTFHGVGGKNRTLLVTEAQYEAVVAAGVVQDNGTERTPHEPVKRKLQRCAVKRNARAARRCKHHRTNYLGQPAFHRARFISPREGCSQNDEMLKRNRGEPAQARSRLARTVS
jgi:hypothetical protein